VKLNYVVWFLIAAALTALSGCAHEGSRRNEAAQLSPAAEDPFDPDRPPTAQTLYVMADVMIAQGYDKRAETLLVRIGQEYPDFRPAYNTLAELQMRQRRIPEAMNTLEAGLKINPADAVLINNLGMCWLIRKDFQKALENFTQAAGLSPENTRYRSNMATALALMGRRDEALALYQQILPKEEALENIRLLCDKQVIDPNEAPNPRTKP
jgi:Flp pilus assembly protein TadD